MRHDPDNLRLILRAQSGDRDACDELLRSVQVGLFRYLVGLLGDRHAAEDALQEVFVLVVRKLPWLRDPDLFRPWLHRIATREAFRRLKRRRDSAARDTDVVIDELPSDPITPPDPELVDRLTTLVAGLSPKSRAVVLLHYREGLTLEQVAQTLSLSIGTVKSRLHHGLTVLRRRAGRPTPATATRRT